MPLIIVVAILVIAVVVIKRYFSNSIIIVKCKDYLKFIWNSSLSFVLVPINVSPFILSNIIIDGMNIKNQFILTLISTGA